MTHEQSSGPITTSTYPISPLNHWLHRALTLAKTYNVFSIATKIENLQKRSKISGFHLAVVGEERRGKSTLINFILQRPLLPKSYAAFSHIALLSAGQDEQMEVDFPDGRYERHPLHPHSWDALSHQLSASNIPQELFPRVFLTLSHSWLERCSLKIIDTPGIGAFGEQYTASLAELFRWSDAVILVVHAAAALSLTEVAFLEQEIVGQRVPRILVVVTMLDTIPVEEQEAVLEDVRRKVAHISSSISVFASAQVAPDTPDVEKIAAIQKHIEKYAVQSEVRTLRNRQVIALLQDYLQQLIEVAHAGLEAAQGDDVRRQEILKAQEAVHYQASQLWSSIEHDLHERRLQLDEAMHRKLFSARESLVAAMVLELSRASDLKVWYEKELPLQLYRNLSNIAHVQEANLLLAIKEDMQWLQHKVESTFHMNVEHSMKLRELEGGMVSQLQRMDVANTEQFRRFSRMGRGMALIANYLLFFDPLGAAIGGAIGEGTRLISDIVLDKQVEAQKEALQSEMKHSIERTIDVYTHSLSDKLHTLYEDMLQDMQDAQKALHAERLAALKESIAPHVVPGWQQLIQAAAALQQEILSTTT